MEKRLNETGVLPTTMREYSWRSTPRAQFRSAARMSEHERDLAEAKDESLRPKFTGTEVGKQGSKTR